MTLTIDDVIALRANCDDYVNAFKALEQSKLDFQRADIVLCIMLLDY